MEKQIIGYRLSGQDNGTSMFRGFAEFDRCPGCGFILDYFVHNSDIRIKKRKWDYSYTYDLRPVVSARFRDFCLKQEYEGMDFLPFIDDHDFFHLVVRPILKFNTQRTGAKFGKLCALCGNYEWGAIGGGDIYLEADRPLPDGFYRTDQMFAEENKKHPLIIISDITRLKTFDTPLRGLTFHAVYGTSA